MTERITENIVRDALRRLGYYRQASGVSVEEQQSRIESVKRLLRAASKSGRGGAGAPEFIISNPANADFILLIECKADSRDYISEACSKLLCGEHVEETSDEYIRRCTRFSIDGVLHYAKFLAKEFNVIAVGICGETEASSKIGTYLHPKAGAAPKLLQTKDGKPIDKLISWSDYIEHGTFDPTVQRVRAEELITFSKDMHVFMRDHAKLTESEKPLLVSGTLIALYNKAFAKSFDEYTPEELQNEWLEVIAKEVRKANIPQAKKDKMVQPYSTIAAHPQLGLSTYALTGRQVGSSDGGVSPC